MAGTEGGGRSQGEDGELAGADGLSKAFYRIFYYLAGFCLFGLFVVMLAGVVFRYIPGLDAAAPWIPGVLNFFQVWLVFLGAVAATAARQHLRIGVFVDRMRGSPRRVVDATIWLVRVGTLALLLYVSIPVVRTGFDATIGGVAFSKGYVYAVLPLALAAMIVLELLALRRRPRGPGQ